MSSQPTTCASFGFKRFAFGIRHGGECAVLVGEHAVHQRFVVAKIDSIHVDPISLNAGVAELFAENTVRCLDE